LSDKVEVKQIEAIELADGNVIVRKETHPLGDALTFEVRSENQYLQASAWRGEEIRNLFYFLKPSVIKHLKRKAEGYESVIEKNQEKINYAIEHKNDTVWEFIIFPSRRRHLAVEEAQQMLEQQKQKLKAIREELAKLTDSN